MTNDNGNKRVKIGLIIFGILVVANIIVHGSRMLSRSNGNAKPIVQPGLLINKVGYMGAGGAVLGVAAGSQEEADKYLEAQMKNINGALKAAESAVASFPRPVELPDLKVELITKHHNYFNWKPLIRVETNIVKEKNDNPVSQPAKVIGSFVVSGKTKLLVQTASEAFVTDGTDEEVSQIENDSSSSSEKLQNVVDILNGSESKIRYQLKDQTRSGGEQRSVSKGK